MNSPISDSDRYRYGKGGVDFQKAVNQRSNSIRVNSSSHNLFPEKQNEVRSNYNFTQSPDKDLLNMIQSPQQIGLTRGRTLPLSSTHRSKKKGVIVIKKESINRQNSFSRSPNDGFKNIDNSLGSPYHSPKANELHNYTSQASGNQDKNQNGNETTMKNSVIVRKTLGQLNKAQLNAFYFDSKMIRSEGPISNTKFNLSLENKKNVPEKIQGFQMNEINSFNGNAHYQRFIQKSDFLEEDCTNKTIEKDSRKSLPIMLSDECLVNQFDQNKIQRELLRERLDHSSESDDIFERQSSQNALSVENNGFKPNSKKIVIQKKNVNFRNQDEHTLSAKFDHSKSQGQLKKEKQLRNLKVQLVNQQADIDQIDLQIMFGPQSKSPDCLRRQRSDNIISMRSGNKSSLNHERSQNHLSLHLSNKLEMPKVVKAMPNNGFQELLRSPTTAYSSSKDSHSILAQSSAQSKNDQSNQKLNKSRQSNIFQIRRSQTFLKERGTTEQQKENQKINKTLNQNLEKKNSTGKKKNFDQSNQKEGSRVSQSLLLDNFFSKSKERVKDKEEQSYISKQANVTKSSEMIKTGSVIERMSPDTAFMRQMTRNPISTKQDELTVPKFTTQHRRSDLSQSLNLLNDGNKCNSPIRVSQYLVDVNYIKAKAQERISVSQQESTSARSQYKNDATIGNLEEPFIENQQQKAFQQSNSNNAILSLSSVNTTEKFKEIIDNLFVPTASVFKKKVKEKEFRRPTQNPVRKSKSLTKSSKSSLVRNKDYEDKMKDFINGKQ